MNTYRIEENRSPSKTKRQQQKLSWISSTGDDVSAKLESTIWACAASATASTTSCWFYCRRRRRRRFAKLAESTRLSATATASRTWRSCCRRRRRFCKPWIEPIIGYCNSKHDLALLLLPAPATSVAERWCRYAVWGLCDESTGKKEKENWEEANHERWSRLESCFFLVRPATLLIMIHSDDTEFFCRSRKKAKKIKTRKKERKKERKSG
jgi:hypothetical protein